jgi:cellulose synthase/poly-beta-1,6-N-acetylglucosamine synthase-like glycosyltransferase
MADLVFVITQGLFLGTLAVLICSTVVAAVFLTRSCRWRATPAGFAPQVSVVIPAYNEERNIGRCLDALLAAGYPRERLEVLVVDDGSTDATREVVRSYAGVRLLCEGHRGKVAALNAGVRSAQHEYLLVIDADTLLRPGSVSEIVRPLADPRVAAVSGMATVGNPRGLLGWFQRVEYLLNALSRESFSSVLHLCPGICGALTCYRRRALQQIDGFKADTAAEDIDVSLELARGGFMVVAVPGAEGKTLVPETLAGLVRQRVRWMKGWMQCIVKHQHLLISGRPALKYFLASQTFWIVYALVSLPLLAYHFAYWLPDNSRSPLDAAFYALRWFSIAGPVYMVLETLKWGINYTYFFGVVAGLLSSVLMLVAHLRYDRLTMGTTFAILFYFPYTLLLSAMMVGSLVAYIQSGGKGAFVKSGHMAHEVL